MRNMPLMTIPAIASPLPFLLFFLISYNAKIPAMNETAAEGTAKDAEIAVT